MTALPGKRRLRVLVVDDEPVARRVLVGLLAEEPDVDLIGACSTGEDAVQALEEEEVDVVFLDVQMPEIGGFEVLGQLDDRRIPHVVFVTAHDDYAIRAFEVGAIDYVLKPFDDDRLRAALDRARRRTAEADRSDVGRKLRQILAQLEAGAPERATVPAPEPAAGGTLDRIPVRVGNRIEFVDLEDVDWIEAEDYYVRLHAGGDSHLVRDSLTRLEARLDPAIFVRIHRSTIVRIRRVREIRSRDSGRYEVVLTDGTELRVSRTRRAQVMRALGLEPGPPPMD